MAFTEHEITQARFLEEVADNQNNPKHSAYTLTRDSNMLAGLARRAADQKIKPSDFRAFIEKVKTDHPALRIDPRMDPRNGRTAVEKLERINDQPPAPDPKLSIKPGVPHPRGGTAQDALDRQKAEEAARMERRRRVPSAWVRFVPRDTEDGE